MTVASLDVRPTLESGIGLYADGARDFVPPFALESRQLHRRGLLCRWYPDLEGCLVCVWQREPVRLPVGLK
jgi:hypothetical protein